MLTSRTAPMKRNAFASGERIKAHEVVKAITKEKKRRRRTFVVATCRKVFELCGMTHKTYGSDCAQEFVRLAKMDLGDGSLPADASASKLGCASAPTAPTPSS